MKGVHHFIECFDEYNVQTDGGFDQKYDYWDFSILCNYRGYFENIIGYDENGLPQYESDQWAFNATGKIMPDYDNAKYYYRAMTCDQARLILGNLDYSFDPDGLFYEKCVDLKANDAKP